MRTKRRVGMDLTNAIKREVSKMPKPRQVTTCTTSSHRELNFELAVESARDASKIHGGSVAKYVTEGLLPWLTLEELGGLITRLKLAERDETAKHQLWRERREAEIYGT